MSSRPDFRKRSFAYAALTANAIRPLPTQGLGVPSFFASWLTSEIAPQWLGVTVADTAAQILRRRRDPIALAASTAAIAGLTYLVHQARRDEKVAEDALAEGLGVDYAEQLDRLPTPAELATPWRSLVNPFRTLTRPLVPIRVERDIAYGDAGFRNLLDIYLPQEPTTGAPVLLQVHGGAWTISRKDQQGIPLMQHLAAQGWICVAINYRMAPKNPFPAHIIDIKKAIAWIRENIAAYGGDPDYIAITGGSAGGHLSALAAVTANDPAWQPGFEDADTTVQCAIPHYGVYDFTASDGKYSSIQMRDAFLGPIVFKRSWRSEPEAFEAASPLFRITADAPDFFVIHGARDTIAPVRQARQFVARLREVSKRSVVYAELPSAQHAFDVFPSIRSQHIVRAIDRYLHWHWNVWRRERATSLDS